MRRPRKTPWSALLLVAAFLLPLGFADPAALHAQDTEYMLLQEVEDQASMKIMSGDYAGALPLLKDLLTRLLQLDRSQVETKTERVRQLIAHAYIALGEYRDAISAFDEYLRKHPDSAWRVQAILLKADCQRFLEQWGEVAETLTVALNKFPLRFDQRMEAMTKLGEAYVRLEKWEDSLQPLNSVVESSFDPSLRARSLTGLLKSYYSLNRSEEIYTLVPKLQDRVPAARFSLAFNLMAIELGDAYFDQGNYELAFLVFKLARPKEEILQGLDTWKENRELVFQRLDKAGADFHSLISVNESLERARGEMEELGKAKEFSEALRARISKTLFEMGRLFEAYWAFTSVHADYPDTQHARDSLFAATTIANDLGQKRRAVEVGRIFVGTERYADSGLIGDVYLNMAQAHIDLKEYDLAVDAINDSLELDPEQAFLDYAYYLRGFSELFLDRLDDALASFAKMKEVSPESEYVTHADFWSAYAQIFKGDFAAAADAFKKFLEDHPGSALEEDARFRLAVSYFGMGDYEAARESSEKFLADYPTSVHRPLVHINLGDIAGALGDLEEALSQYSTVEDFAPAMNLVHLAVFQAGKIYEAAGKWEELVRHFQAYMDRYGDAAKGSEAAAHISRGLKELGRFEEMLARNEATISRYGNDVDALGIDYLMDDYLQVYQSRHGEPPMRFLSRQLGTARALGQRTLELRMEMALSKSDPARPLERKFTNDDLKAASPSVLEWIGDSMRRKGDRQVARMAYAAAVERFPDVEWAATSLMSLAEMDAEDGELNAAIARLEKLYESFPASELAGRAVTMQGDFLREQKRYDEAIQRYEKVLLVREWRGELWPEALYKMGLCHLDKDRQREAFAYFQRIYILYASYTDWAAKAYLQSAICLEKLNRPDEALQTYRELLDKEAMKDTDAYRKAREAEARLATLQPA